ncbi:MAG: LysM peptidoglycan-binding domain-containing protein [Candidatus Ozemobacteraceae bacterium]|jgi:hypothetical protein|nr:LysM peptidoglycan-binding domain-containing protein [bacterium]
MKKTGIFVFIFIGLLLAAPASYANDSSGLFNVSTEIEQPAVSIPVSSEEVEVTVTTSSAEVIEEEAPVASAPAPEYEPISYTIASNDNLWALAEKYLGDGSRYPEIVEANKDKYPSLVSKPGLIHPGWKLEIPPKDKAKPEPKEEPKEEVKEEPKDDKGAQDVVVEAETGTNVDEVAQVKPMTTLQKLKKLNDALDKINKDIKADGYKITDLTEKTVRDLINKGYMTEEEWMAMNPPEGWSYDVRLGKVTLVNKRNRPLTNLELLVMTVKDVIDINKDKKEAEKAKTSEVKKEETKKEEPKKEEPKEVSDEELANNDSESKQKAYDEAMGRTTKTQTSVETATKTATETEVKKAVEETKVGADKLYADAMKEIGAPDIRDVKFRDYNKAITSLSKLLSWKEQNKYAYILNGYTNLIDLEKTLKSSQETYVKKVDKNDTGWFGGSINSAGKNVESNKAALKKTWDSLQEAIAIAKTKADDSAKKIEENKKLAESLAKQKEEIGYDPSKAKELQNVVKQLKDIESDNKKLQKDVDAYKEVAAIFKV